MRSSMKAHRRAHWWHTQGRQKPVGKQGAQAVHAPVVGTYLHSVFVIAVLAQPDER